MEKNVCIPDAGTLAVTDSQAADMLGVSVDVVREHICNGALKASCFGGRLLIRPDSITELLLRFEAGEGAKRHCEAQKQ
jgi:hypothetical protein